MSASYHNGAQSISMRIATKMLLEITIKTFEQCARNTVNVDRAKTTRPSLSFNRHLALIKIKLQRIVILIVVPPV